MSNVGKNNIQMKRPNHLKMTLPSKWQLPPQAN